MTYETIKTYWYYNQRRYSKPWVCKMKSDGGYDFSVKVGEYTGKFWEGGCGDLVVFDPVKGQVYGYGQKDYRGNNTRKSFAVWDGEKFIECDRLGRIKSEE